MTENKAAQGTHDELEGIVDYLHKVYTINDDYDPNVERQRRISEKTENINDTVKLVLGKNVKADRETADKLVTTIAYKIAQTDGHKGELKDFNEEAVRKVLSDVSTNTGNPLYGQLSSLVANIMNAPSAKPGDALYSTDSALGQLIGYAAQQSDIETRKMNLYSTKLAENWQKPETGIKLQHDAAAKFGMPLSGSATANDFLSEVRLRAQLKSSYHAQAESGKTYLQPSSLKPTATAYKKAA